MLAAPVLLAKCRQARQVVARELENSTYRYAWNSRASAGCAATVAKLAILGALVDDRGAGDQRFGAWRVPLGDVVGVADRSGPCHLPHRPERRRRPSPSTPLDRVVPNPLRAARRMGRPHQEERGAVRIGEGVARFFVIGPGAERRRYLRPFATDSLSQSVNQPRPGKTVSNPTATPAIAGAYRSRRARDEQGQRGPFAAPVRLSSTREGRGG